MFEDAVRYFERASSLVETERPFSALTYLQPCWECCVMAGVCLLAFVCVLLLFLVSFACMLKSLCGCNFLFFFVLEQVNMKKLLRLQIELLVLPPSCQGHRVRNVIGSLFHFITFLYFQFKCFIHVSTLFDFAIIFEYTDSLSSVLCLRLFLLVGGGDARNAAYCENVRFRARVTQLLLMVHRVLLSVVSCAILYTDTHCCVDVSNLVIVSFYSHYLCCTFCSAFSYIICFHMRQREMERADTLCGVLQTTARSQTDKLLCYALQDFLVSFPFQQNIRFYANRRPAVLLLSSLANKCGRIYFRRQ